ncbi:hypothetical protein [Planctomycetes bacterium TBK1r]|uniref:Phospholipase D-like domain-containing protein n=1 Tax=Stieleria magnilauensis TaxID=2527963 RepID=A0ABX5XVR4_9BACT|nr:hypothetical protein TBK1r_43660 [Planctomycetes bacterium TBK1r]
MAELTGYQPADVIAELGSDLPRRALFTTFTFSPGAFQQQYVTPLVQHGCGDIAVLADRMGYSQSLFSAAAVQGIGSDYRLRQVSVPGAFHGKLVLIRTISSMIVGVGSGNLTASGLQTNAEVGALYVIKEDEQLTQLDNLFQRLRHLALLDESPADEVSPISLTPDARLITSIDASLIDQMNLPSDVRKIEIVSPFVDGQLEVLHTMRDLWPEAHIRLRLDPGFGALSESLLAIDDNHVEVQVPIESKEGKEEVRRPAVHGKLICFVGREEATAILGSANLSRPAFLAKENFEAVVERRIPVHAVEKLLSVPRVRWRKAKSSDRRIFEFSGPVPSFAPLIAALTLRRLSLSWSAQASTVGIARIWCRGRCEFEQEVGDVDTDGDRHSWDCEIDVEARESLVASHYACYAEIELDNDRRFRGWVDVTDMLGVSPEAKRQLVLLDSIASDPMGCKQQDVVKFIEHLQRNLKSAGRAHSFRQSNSSSKEPEEYEDTPVQRSMLLETGKSGGLGQSLLLTQLLNRSLDTALRDLRFFARDNADRGTGKRKSGEKGAATQVSGSRTYDSPLPPKIETVLSQLFGQMADAFDSADSIRETVELISQIPTCLKALAYSVERWLLSNQTQRALHHHFQKVAIACLAPGVVSILHKSGAVRRIDAGERAKLQGSSSLAEGIAMLEAYLLLQFRDASPENRHVLKDMYEVLKEIPAIENCELKAAATELFQMQAHDSEEQPDLDKLQSELEQTAGEMAGLRDCRAALRELIVLASKNSSSDAELRPLAERASGNGIHKPLIELIRSSGSRLQLVEVDTAETACPQCYTTFPIAVCSQLNDTTRVCRCSCGVLLVRSLER